MDQPTKKISIPIKAKLIGVLTALILCALGLYVAVASELFIEDKSAYIYETSLSAVETDRLQVRSFLQRLMRANRLLYNFYVINAQGHEAFEITPPSPAPYQQIFPPAVRATDIRRKIIALPKKIPAGALTPRLLEKILAKTKLLLLLSEKIGDIRGLAIFSRALGRVMTSENIKKFDEMIDLQFYYGKSLSRIGNFSAAADALNRYLSIIDNPRYGAEARFELGELAFIERRYSEAISLYSQPLGQLPTQLDDFARYKIAWSLYRRGNFPLAARRFNEAWGKARSQTFRDRVLIDAKYMFAEWGDLNAARRFFRGRSQSIFNDTAKLARQFSGAVDPGAPPKRSYSQREQQRILRETFLADPDLVQFRVYRKGNIWQRVYNLHKVEALATLDLGDGEKKFFAELDRRFPVRLSSITEKTPRIYNHSIEGLPLLTIAQKIPDVPHVIVARAKLDRLLSIFSRNNIYQSLLADRSGQLFGHFDPGQVFVKQTLLKNPHFAEVTKRKVGSGVREYRQGGRDYLSAFSDVGLFDLVIVNKIEKDKAFQAVNVLLRKSVYFAIFIICMSTLIGIIFARSFTRPIQTLYQGTEQIAGGDFSKRVHVASRDEIGALSTSFNFMAERIQELLAVEKEKARMQQELEVAHLVQDSFFPPAKINIQGFEIASFYTPSSECGGDWWGYIEQDGKVMVLIGDATGHGVPAALITATASSCASVIDKLCEEYPNLIASPAHILSLLNRTIFLASQGRIQMTFFAGLFDASSKTLTYANAAHNQPYLYEPTRKAATRKDLKPLLSDPAIRLGQDLSASYSDYTISYPDGSVFTLFTDGFLECENPEGKEFGSRRFEKSIAAVVSDGPAKICSHVVDNATAFFANTQPKDDLTLVVIQPLDNVGMSKQSA